jgi:oligopeptide/dipeptide ABC transporter ATP-binding protein
MSEADTVVSVSDLHVTFARRGIRKAATVHAVAGVSFDVARGETLCIVGESGSGKTTTVRAIARLVNVTSGRIMVDGTDVSQLRGRSLRRFRRRVQVVFQDPYESLNPRQTVEAVMTEVLRAHAIGDSAQARRAMISDNLEACGLAPASEFLHRYPHELSGGQRQRVCIAAAAILEPDVLIADEPVSMLDVSVRAGILRLLAELRRSRNMTLIFVTHDLSLAWAIADRVGVMYLGRLLELGPAQEVISNPANPYTEALVSAIPVADPTYPPVEVHLKAGGSPATGDIEGCRFHPRCLYALEQCEHEDPELEEVNANHTSACLRSTEIRPALRGAAQQHLGQGIETLE